MLVTGAKAEEISTNSCVDTLAARATNAFGAVKKVTAGPLMHLEAGEEVRVAGVAIPGIPRNHKDLDAANTAEAALTQLRTLTKGTRVQALPAMSTDRHGRKWAQLFALKDTKDHPVWLQAAMVSSGHARVAPNARGLPCAGHLLALEAKARARRLGVWGQKGFEILEAWATRKIRRRENSFQLVQGQVRAVAETKRFTYVNFGRNWRTDFTVNISTKTAKKLKDEGFSIADLKGKTVRVRGWVQYANGPMIRVSAREQIEVLSREAK